MGLERLTFPARAGSWMSRAEKPVRSDLIFRPTCGSVSTPVDVSEATETKEH